MKVKYSRDVEVSSLFIGQWQTSEAVNEGGFAESRNVHLGLNVDEKPPSPEQHWCVWGGEGREAGGVDRARASLTWSKSSSFA